MKIKDANAAALTNFDVLDFLRNRGAENPTRVLVPVAPSEFKVYDYLIEGAACNQTSKSIHTFLEKCKEYNLAKAELLNIINIRPATAVEIDSIIEQCEVRFGEELDTLLETINDVLPPGPRKPDPEEIEEKSKELANGEQTETAEKTEDEEGSGKDDEELPDEELMGGLQRESFCFHKFKRYFGNYGSGAGSNRGFGKQKK